MTTLSVGSVAPDFEAKTQDETKTVKLSSLRGKRVVLYFYPKDNTPGCTTEACDFRDAHSEFEEKNAVIIGVSFDHSKSHAGFAKKFDLPFTLAVDEDKAIATAYGVYREKKMYGRTSLGIVRSTFVIDEAGKIAKIYDGVKVAGHAKVVADFLGEAGSTKAVKPEKAPAAKSTAKKTVAKTEAPKTAAKKTAQVAKKKPAK